MDNAILGDAYDVLPTLPHSYFDLILTDNPYKISRPNNFKTMGREGFDWEWDNSFDPISWIPLCVPLLRPGGALICFTDWKLLGQQTAAAVCNGMIEKDPIENRDGANALGNPLVLEKPNPMPRNIDRRYVSDKEWAFWVVKPGGKWTFNRLKPSASYQRATFRYPTPRGKNRKHPTQKPLELFRDLILIHSDPKMRILDPFAGAGTTAKAAHQVNRQALLIEKDPEFFRLCMKA